MMTSYANVKKSELLSVKPEVKQALESHYPVVALESTLITHGMPYPHNVQTALEVEDIVREAGAVPATIAVLDGKIRVGLEGSELEWIGKNNLTKKVLKLSQKDLPYALATHAFGGTTVAATLFCAQLAGIPVFATGGIGGVHRGAEKTFDISADLQELAKTQVALVCAGAKSILDIGLTLEMLETLSVPVIGYQTDVFPAFYSRESEFPVHYRMDSLKEIADLIRYKRLLGTSGGVLIANPIPSSEELKRDEVEKHIQDGLRASIEQKIQGKEVTPFLLDYLVSKTGGATLSSNIALIKNNAKVAAQLARALLT
jgi:pseudouridine-5'-phosphate glycosidase